MVTSAFIIGVLNLALGAGLAILAEKPWKLILPSWPRRRETAVDDSPVEVDAGPGDEWQRPVIEAQIVAETFFEKLLWVMHLEGRRLRAKLNPIDQILHHPERAQFLDGQFCDALKAWAAALDLWTVVLQRESEVEPYRDLAARLEEFLLDLAFDARAVGKACDVAVKEEPLNIPEIRKQMLRLYLTFDKLILFADRHLAMVLSNEDKLSCIDDDRRVDEGTATFSRLGLETLFHQWWTDDAERVRIVSGVLVDVDRACRLNETDGVVVGDCVLSALGEIVRDSVRKERGFDRVARYSGQSFLLFLGDTGAANAANAAERIRQAIEVTSFEVNGEPIEATVSAGVAEVGKSESLPEFLLRLESAVGVAKDAGRNCTAVDRGRGAQVETAAQYQVERREVIVEIEDALSEQPVAECPS